MRNAWLIAAALLLGLGTGCIDLSKLRAPDGSALSDLGVAPDDGAPGSVDAGGDGAADDAGEDGATDDAGAPGPAVRLVAPLSTAAVTTWRPTLRWELANGADGARVQICRDRACGTEVTSFEADGATGAPAVDLPAGVVFWRAYPRMNGVFGTVASATWEFTVGARDTPTDTSWGTIPDVNGDGYADVVVGATQGNLAIAYLGSATGPDSSSAVTLQAPVATPIGDASAVTSAGDVNGDGYADVVVGACAGQCPFKVAEVYLYLGGPDGLNPRPVITLTDPAGSGTQFGWALIGGIDFEGDGYGDIAVVAGLNTYLFSGGPSGLGASPTATLEAGGPLAVGDFDGDGYADLLVGSGTSRFGPAAHIFPGGPSGVDQIGSIVTIGLAGMGGLAAGDFNGDGRADVVTTSSFGTGSPGVGVYFGSATGLAPASSVTTFVGTTDGPGQHVLPEAIGDVNGDGYGDLAIVGAGSTLPVYSGGAAGLASSPAVILSPPGSDPFSTAAGAGDVDRDGVADLLIGATGANLGTGVVYYYRGSPTGLNVDPAAALAGPKGEVGYFGGFLASASDDD